MAEFDITKKDNLNIFNFSEEALESMQGIVLLEFSVKKGDQLKKGDKVMVIESMKGTMELESPVTGNVQEINDKASHDTDSITKDTWLLKIK